MRVSTDLSAARKQELLARLLAQQGYAAPGRDGIPPRPRDPAPPLSFAQQRLWFLQQLEPDSGFYNIHIALRLTGAVDQAALRLSLAEILRRHEALRTHFPLVDGQPVQAISPAPDSPPLPVDDLADLDPARREAEFQRRRADEARRPFDLATGPLLRARCLKLGEQDHGLLLTLHHSVADGWSVGVLVREFAALYGAFQAGKPSPLADLPIQYADYAVWQRRHLQGETLAEPLAYWRTRLAGAPSLSTFPADHPRPALQTYGGAAFRFGLSAELSQSLRQVGQTQGATLFMVLLAAFQLLLFRHSGQSDLCVGAPVANRNRREVEGLIGFFVNTLAIRADLSGNPTFLSLLEQVRIRVVEAQSRQEVPFEKLVEELQPARNPSYGPFFQTAFVLQNAPLGKLELPGLQVEVLDEAGESAKFDVLLEVAETADGLDARLEYNTDLFEPASIERLAGHYRTLLAGIAARPAARLSELPLLTAAETRQLLEQWNTPPAAYDPPYRLHERIAAQAARIPEAVALVLDGETLSYAELNRRADRLAQRLLALGLGPDRVAGICAERSLELVIGLLGILKAGGAYLPLDPDYPPERLAYMLDNARPAVVLAQPGLLDRLPPHPHTLPLTAAADAAAEEPAAHPLPLVEPDHLAYVIYTSGSTGRPKGVGVPHRGLINRLEWMQARYGLTPADAVLQKTQYSFDVSVWEFFWPLLAGARLVLARPGEHREPSKLMDLIEREGVTTLHFVPSMLTAFLDCPDIRPLPGLRRVICSGEALDTATRNRFVATQSAGLHNLYGPTEASIDVTAHACSGQAVGGPVPIGRPIDNIQIYLLDPHLNLVPAGVPGELYIGGVGLARGYINRPELTAERFLPNPYAPAGTPAHAARLYRTGDLARWRGDGEIEYLGRTDHQVKVRGHRIELGEIEAVLTQHPGVREAVVVTQRDRADSVRLVAYAAPPAARRDAPPEAWELREFVAARLPGYMVPAAFVVLDRLPLNANGKVDRKALPAPDAAQASRQGYLAPRTAVEAQLAALWADVLSLERVGVLDDFFELGGLSLLATQLLIKIKARFAAAPSLGDLFTAPTVETQARLIEGKALPGQPVAVVDLESEAALGFDVVPARLDPVVNLAPERVLLTGATGFLGAFLVAELLRQTSATVYCLARAASPEAALQRVLENLARYRLRPPDAAARIVGVPGDLAQPRLGLSETAFADLGATLDAIYHNGALVNFIQPYAALRPANVAGTREVLRLACLGKVKPLHYVSTVSVFGDNSSAATARGFAETDFPVADAHIAGGYTQTKWVAERLVRAAAARGLPVTIHRPAVVTGNRADGAWNTDDFLCRLIKGCVLLGLAPARQTWLDMVPVDYVAESVVWLSRQAGSIGRTFHLNNPDLLASTTLIDWIAASGWPLRKAPLADWRRALFAAAAASPESHPLLPLLPMFEGANLDEERMTAADEQRFDCRATQAALAGSGIAPPLMTQDLWAKYLASYQASGYLPRAA
jgi:amino acid adenylation domain-containing protein/thioester reductase-like protein